MLAAILMARKGTRANALLYYGSVIIAGLIFAAAAYPGMGGSLPLVVLPPILAILCLPFGFLLSRWIALLFAWDIRRKRVLIVGVLSAAILYAALAALITTPISIGGHNDVQRISPAEPGENKLAIVTNREIEAEALTVGIRCIAFSAEDNTERELASFTPALSADGDTLSADFTAPDGTQAVRVQFEADTAVKIQSAVLTNTASGGKVTVDGSHALIPEFVFQRFQGMRYNQSAFSRVVYFKEALSIAGQRPVFGSGAGTFETKLMQVQDSFYETKYVHNHYLQVLLETGVVGLIAYLAMLCYAAFLLLRSRRRVDENADDAIPLFASLLLIVLHTAIDFELSFEWFLVVFYILLAIAAAMMEQQPAERGGVRALSRFRPILAKSLILILPCFMLLLIIGTALASYGVNHVEDDAGDISLEKLTGAVKRGIILDPFHAADYKSAYVTILTGEEVPDDSSKLAAEYAADLGTISDRSVGACETLIQYYYAQDDFVSALRYAERLPLVRPMDAAGWTNALEYCDALYEEGDDAQKRLVSDAIERIRGNLERVNAAASVPVVLER
jgi:hypothetical protein